VKTPRRAEPPAVLPAQSRYVFTRALLVCNELQWEAEDTCGGLVGWLRVTVC
jgi:hypothetical protein